MVVIWWYFCGLCRLPPVHACRGARWIRFMRMMLHKLDWLLTRGSDMCNHLFVCSVADGHRRRHLSKHPF